ncbi:cellulose binding domain-containing protein [Micromonospora vulcania]|uniref:Cellulose binding domain-containing protein n=1 Tax=Micromonospora vulcania TaxID=1441873 RepID=A0ABW1HG07_9ACTN
MSGMPRAPRPSRGPVAIASSPWIVVLAGVVVMVVLVFVALGAYRGRSPAPDDGAVPPVVPLPQVTDPAAAPTPSRSSAALLPGLSPRATGSPPSTPASRPPSAGPPATRPPTRAPEPPAVGGRYRVVQSWDSGFIGEVLIVNATRESRDWTARLDYAGGRLVTSWVEGVPQGTARPGDGSFTYTSGVDVPAGGSVALRFEWQRASTTPRECTVDGVRCSGL